jgi:small ligand-binding sensory domain FIST
VTRFAAALSEHPLATQAVGETVGAVLEQLDGPPDLVTLFVTEAHTGAVEDIARAVRSLLNPRVLLGATAVSVLGGAQEVEQAPAISLFAVQLGVELEPIRLEAFAGADGEVVIAGGAGLSRGEGTLLLLADPFSFPADDVVAHLAETVPDVAVIGGLASAASRAGGNVLVLDDERFRDGAVGVLVPPEVPIRTVVSQGCRPIGQPLVVTRAERNVIYELAGQPALDRLMGQLEALDPDTRAMAARGLQIGVVIDERREVFEPGDFLVRAVLGADRSAGAVAVGEEVSVGTTVQFHVRDAATAHEELCTLLAGASPAAGALVFTCNGRGAALFGEPDHDATTVSEALGSPSLAGMFCAGEIGPVGGRAFLHSFTASVALFG